MPTPTTSDTIVALSDGGVAAAGGSFVSTASDVLVARYTRGGARRWLKLYGGPDSLGGQALSEVRGAGGAIYVAGDVTTAATAEDSLLLKYGKAGALLWARSHTSPGMANDFAFSVAVAPVGSVYVAGGQNGQAGAERRHAAEVQAVTPRGAAYQDRRA